MNTGPKILHHERYQTWEDYMQMLCIKYKGSGNCQKPINCLSASQIYQSLTNFCFLILSTPYFDKLVIILSYQVNNIEATFSSLDQHEGLIQCTTSQTKSRQSGQKTFQQKSGLSSELNTMIQGHTQPDDAANPSN
jgi:hypothetical protein